MSLNLHQQRELTRLTAIVDRVIEADRRFFQRQPWRSYRLRVSARAEVQAGAVLGSLETRLPDGLAYYTAVRQIAPGIRTRKFLIGAASKDVDLSEDVCRRIYQTAGGIPQMKDIERRLEQAAGGSA